MRDATRILVIGGGPVGSTTAGLLAREGFDVTLQERDRFPRYHIEESILPSWRPIFELLGIWNKIQKPAVRTSRRSGPTGGRPSASAGSP